MEGFNLSRNNFNRKLLVIFRPSLLLNTIEASAPLVIMHLNTYSNHFGILEVLLMNFMGRKTARNWFWSLLWFLTLFWLLLFLQLFARPDFCERVQLFHSYITCIFE